MRRSWKVFANLLNSNPGLVARHFKYKVEVFFKEIMLDGPMSKTKSHFIKIGFKRWYHTHVHLDLSEAVVQRCSVKKVLLEISQNSQESTCARVFFVIKLQAWASGTGAFLWILRSFHERLLLQKTPGVCFYY